MQGGPHLDATSGLPALVGMLARLLYGYGVLLGVWSVVRGRGRLGAAPRAVHLLLLVAIVVPIVALARHSVPVFPYYLVTTFPVPYVYGALALSRLWRGALALRAPFRRLARAAMAIGLGGLVAVPLALAAVFFSVIGQYWPAAVYGMPWRMTDQVVQQTVAFQGRYHPARVLVPVHDQELSVIGRLLLRRKAPVETFDDTRMLVLTDAPTLYLAVGDTPAARYLAASYGPDQVAQTLLPGNSVAVRWYLLPPVPPIGPPGGKRRSIGAQTTTDDRSLGSRAWRCRAALRRGTR